MIPPPSPRQPLLVWWVMWAAFFLGLFQIYFFLGGANSTQPATPEAPLVAALGLLPLAASVFVRWAVLPRIPAPTQAFPIFVVGIALAEASCFIGLFIFPTYKAAFFAFSLLGIAQFIPVFAQRYFPR